MITELQTYRKTQDLIDRTTKEMARGIMHALRSGGINFDDYANDYELPKIILQVLLGKAMDENTPLSPKNRETVKNLRRLV